MQKNFAGANDVESIRNGVVEGSPTTGCELPGTLQYASRRVAKLGWTRSPRARYRVGAP
jgi:hypothetical protein